MSKAVLEHMNMTVSDSEKTARMLCQLFDWKIRWQGSSLNDGKTVHVGLEEFYLALYSPKKTEKREVDNCVTAGALNHVAVIVDDLNEVKVRVLGLGFKIHSYQDYEPGQRFYFNDQDGIEYEVVNYQ